MKYPVQVIADILIKSGNRDIPVIIAINKIDLSNQSDLEKIVELWVKEFPKSPVIPVSALKNFNLETLLNAITSKPAGRRAIFPQGSAH